MSDYEGDIPIFECDGPCTFIDVIAATNRKRPGVQRSPLPSNVSINLATCFPSIRVLPYSCLHYIALRFRSSCLLPGTHPYYLQVNTPSEIQFHRYISTVNQTRSVLYNWRPGPMVSLYSLHRNYNVFQQGSVAMFFPPCSELHRHDLHQNFARQHATYILSVKSRTGIST